MQDAPIPLERAVVDAFVGGKYERRKKKDVAPATPSAGGAQVLGVARRLDFGE